EGGQADAIDHGEVERLAEQGGGHAGIDAVEHHPRHSTALHPAAQCPRPGGVVREPAGGGDDVVVPFQGLGGGGHGAEGQGGDGGGQSADGAESTNELDGLEVGVRRLG